MLLLSVNEPSGWRLQLEESLLINEKSVFRCVLEF